MVRHQCAQPPWVPLRVKPASAVEWVKPALPYLFRIPQVVPPGGNYEQVPSFIRNRVRQLGGSRSHDLGMNPAGAKRRQMTLG